MDYDKVKAQLGEWAPKFQPFIESESFDSIFRSLKDYSREGRTICPQAKDVFRTFRETPYKDLKAIFILQDPYPWIKNGVMVADGIPMSCSYTKVCQPSLELFYQGIEDDLGIEVPRQPDLSYLSKQGILLLNSSLTVELNKPGSHKGLWDPFMKYLIEEVINYYNTGTCYVSFGKQALPIAKMILPFMHWGFEVEHPAAAAHKERKWDHQKIFSKINKVVKDNNNEKINWSSGSIQESSAVGYQQESSKVGIRGKVLKE